MLAEDVDFYQVFKIQPTSMVLLTADLEIVDANEEFLEETGRNLDDLIGHNIFEEFPKSRRGRTAETRGPPWKLP